MSLTQHSLLKFGFAMVLVSCTSSRNASKGLVACQTAKDCPAGNTCEQVQNIDAFFSACCKDKGCASGATPGMGVDGSAVTSQDGQSSVLEAGYLVDGQPSEASTNPDLPDTALKTLDAQGTCGSDDDCPTTAPMCLKHLCAACTTNTDCTGNASGDMCNTTSGRCAFCLADTDCKDASKPLCGQGKCTACTYATTPNGCCADTDCQSGGASTVATCDTTAHSCRYTCDATHKSCTTGGACIPKGGCCGDSDCPGSVANECQYEGCLADTTCGPKNKPNTTSCSSGAGTCDGNGACIVCSTGQYKCTGNFLQKCNDTRTGFTTGTDCGANLCNPSGPTCYNCVPGKSCDSANVHNVITCASDHMTKTTTTDNAKFCVNGQFVECLAATDCPTPTNPCVQKTCNANVCGTTNVTASTSCAGNGTCDGAGHCNGPTGRKSCPSGQGLCQGMSCCKDILVTGGAFPMGLGSSGEADMCPSGLLCDSNAEQPEHATTVSDFYMDVFEVTVGRFREFYKKYGISPSSVPPGDGTGANHVTGSGWQNASWTSLLPGNQTALAAGLACPTGGTPTWATAATTDTEVRAINCVTWYEAFAFCVWDGGRLPTEAEWEYAAAAGAANQLYPWGQTAPDSTRANYYRTAQNVLNPVGAFSAGAGVFGQLDLAGGMAEWTFDWYSDSWYHVSSGGNSCTNCANVSSPSTGNYRSNRGGAWDTDTTNIRAAARSGSLPASRNADVGFRCVRDHG